MRGGGATGGRDILTGRVVELGGVSVLLKASDGARADAVDRMLGLVPPSTAPPSVELRYSARAPALPRRAPDRASEGFRVWMGEDTMHLEIPSGARARVSSTSAWLGTGGDDVVRAFHLLFQPAITHLLSFQDRFTLHAGAVAAGGLAYPMLGRTGTGKSTLAAAALEHGWRLLGDDMVVVRRDGQGLMAAGIPKLVAVPTELGSRLARRPLADDLRGRCEVMPDVLEPGWFPVAGVIAVGHGSSSTESLESLDGRAMLRMVLDAYTSSLNPPLLRRFFPVAAALSRLPAWELRHCPDPATRLARAGEALAIISNEHGRLVSAPSGAVCGSEIGRVQ